MASGQGSSQSSPAESDRLFNSLLRRVTARTDIHDTVSLVQAANTATDRIEKESLRSWLWNYFELFLARPDHSVTHSDIMEYAALAHFIPGGSITEPDSYERRDVSFLNGYLFNLQSRATFGDRCRDAVITALVYILDVIDERVYRDDSEGFWRLAETLLKRMTWSRQDTEDLKQSRSWSAFLALLQIDNCVNRSTPTDDSESTFRNQFKQNVRNFTSVSGSYAIKFQLKLSEAHNRSELMTEWDPNLRNGVRSFLRVNKELRRIAARFVDQSAHNQGIEIITKTEPVSESWYKALVMLTLGVLIDISSKKDVSHFNRAYESALRTQRSPRNNDKRTELQFGIITQLTVAVEDGDSLLRETALRSLFNLASTEALEWETESVAEIFESYKTIAKNPELYDRAVEELKEIVENYATSPHLKTLTIEWRSTEAIQRKLRNQPLQEQPGSSLYTTVRHVSGRFMSPEQAEQNIKDLKARYVDSFFSEVKRGLDDGSTIAVKSLKHSLVLRSTAEDLSESVLRKRAPGGGSQLPEEKSQSLLTIEDVVSRFRENNKILICGGPGTGKTSISRRIAVEWADGSLGIDFSHVFVLSARHILSKVYDNSSARVERTVESAIANYCFPRKRNGDYDALLVQIQNALYIPSTLLIFDELDWFSDHEDRGKDFMSSALQRRCKLLLLTRPYAITEAMRSGSVIFECIGFSKDQLSEFIDNELQHPINKDLTEFLRQWPFLHELTLVPNSAQLICYMWKMGSLTTSECIHSCMCPFKVLTRVVMNWMDQLLKRFEDSGLVEHQAILDTLGNLALTVMAKDDLKIQSDVLTSQNRLASKREILRETGFLTHRLSDDQYEFAYSGFRDYFAGAFVSRSIFSKNAEYQRHVAAYLPSFKYTKAWKTALCIAMRSACEQHSFFGFEEMFEFLSKDPKEISGVVDTLCTVKLLDVFLETADPTTKALIVDGSNVTGNKIANDALQLFSRFKSDLDVLERIAACFHCLPNVSREYDWLLDELVEESLEAKTSEQIRQLGRVAIIARSFPDHFQSILDALERFFDDDDPCKREAAFQAFGSLIGKKELPNLKPLDIANKAHADESDRVRIQAVQLMIQTRNAYTEATPDIRAMIERSYKNDASVSLRSCALRALTLIDLARKIKPELLLRELGTNLDQINEEILTAAMSLLPDIVAVFPDEERSLTICLGSGLQHKAAVVREAAMKEIQRFWQHAPSKQDSLRDFIEKGSDDASASVRDIAAVQDLAMKLATPAQEDLETLVSKILRESTPRLCSLVLELLLTPIAAWIKDSAPIIDSLVFVCLNSSAIGVQNEAKAVLQSCSFGALLGAYWRLTDNTIIVDVLSSMLLLQNVVYVIDKEQINQAVVFILKDGERIESPVERSREEIGKLVDCLRENLQQRYPEPIED